MAGEPFHLMMPRDLGRAAGRRAARLGQREGRDPRDAAPPRRDGGIGRIIEYYGPGLAALVRDGSPRHRQHGRRARRDHHGVPVRRRGAPVPASQGREDDFGRDRWPIDDAQLRRPRGDRSLDARAADRHAVEPGQRRAGARGRRPPRSTRRTSARRPTPGCATSRSPRADRRRKRQAHDRRLVRRQPDLAPDSRDLVAEGYLAKLIRAGARIHQAGCNGCIGMGQAPATGRSACAPCRATFPAARARARTRCICAARRPRRRRRSPADHRPARPRHALSAVREPETMQRQHRRCSSRRPPTRRARGSSRRARTSAPLPELEPLPRRSRRRCCSSSATTSRPTRSCRRARGCCRSAATSRRSAGSRSSGSTTATTSARGSCGTHGHVVVGGRELRPGLEPRARRARAALPRPAAPSSRRASRASTARTSQLRGPAARFVDPADYDRIEPGDEIVIPHVADALEAGGPLRARDLRRSHELLLRHDLSRRQIEQVLAGGIIPLTRRHADARETPERRTR